MKTTSITVMIVIDLIFFSSQKLVQFLPPALPAFPTTTIHCPQLPYMKATSITVMQGQGRRVCVRDDALGDAMSGTGYVIGDKQLPTYCTHFCLNFQFPTFESLYDVPVYDVPVYDVNISFQKYMYLTNDLFQKKLNMVRAK